MSENVKFECACELGYDKGALKKTLENNIFTIFGNTNQKNTIVIRYHGELTDNETNNSTTFNMFFYFDEAENDKKTVRLQKCTKCQGDCYCITIDLESYSTLSFGFFDDKNNYELNGYKPFRLTISPDPISSIMQRYGFEQNNNLPICETAKCNISAFNNLLNIIKNFFTTTFKGKKHLTS